MKKSRLIVATGLAAIVFALATASCVPQKKMIYLKDAEMLSTTQSKDYVNDRTVNYKLQPGDNLYIRAINTIDNQSASSFNGDNNGTRSTNSFSESGIYLTSYTIDEEGCIELPLAGKIEVKNLTLEQAKDKMQNAIDHYMNQTMLVVKLTNFNLTLLGEVNKPGMYKIYQSQINLFEAISMAGNMTNFAKRDEVKIIRQTDDGSEIITVDMGRADILESPYYYLKPNDIIIVDPLKIKQWGFTTFPYSTIISITTLGITLFTLFKNISKPN